MSALSQLSSEELVARCIAPIKRDFIIPFSARAASESEAAPGTAQGQQAAGKHKKSGKQMKKERQHQRAHNLCTNFAIGKCHYGERCKFSHDIQLYIQNKPTDLPGSCPFSCLADCPYGLTCRWYNSHKGAAANAAASSAAQQDAADSMSQGAQQAGAAADAPAPGSDAAYLQSLTLPVPSSIQQPVNTLSKELQHHLWKNTYDFSKADIVLQAMGLKVSKYGNRQPQQQQQQGRANGKAPQAAASTDAQAAAPAAAAAAAVGAAAAVAPAAAHGSSTAPAAGSSAALAADLLLAAYDAASSEEPAAEPAAKRVKTEAAQQEQQQAEQAQQQQQLAAPASLTDPNPGEVRDARVRLCEVPRLDLRGKTYLAPLTTVGNLPYRRVCKGLGADVTCGEMALVTNLLQGQASEWALLKRHPSEDCFGVQICGGFPDTLARAVQLIEEHVDCTFVDINMGCPIDLVCDKGGGSSLLQKPKRMEELVRSSSTVLASKPLTIKIRKGYNDGQDVAHNLVPHVRSWGAQALTLHGRTRQQRYSRAADWEYIQQCAAAAPDLQMVGNGDVMSYTHWNEHLQGTGLASCMIARGALIKPWIFTEIKEQRHWDISASERLDMLKQFAAYGLEHWGSDSKGVENSRRFLLEWCSFLHRYIPVGLLEVLPQDMQWRPPAFRGRSELETLLGSANPADWVKISTMLLGPPPPGFTFAPKHKSNAYTASEADMAAAQSAAPLEEEQAQG